MQPTQIEPTHDGLNIQWSGSTHHSFYSWDFLMSYLKSDRPGSEDLTTKYFGSEGHNDSFVSSEGFYTNEAEAVGRLTHLIRHNGFAFVTDVSTESAEHTETLLEKIAFIRQTHYGGFYDFIPDLALADTAYTNIALPAHTDTTYFTDPAGLQAFHLLSHKDPEAERTPGASLGGQSLLVDGYGAAEILRSEDSKAFDVLSRVKLPWHASGNQGITISPDKLYPVLEINEDNGKVHRVRWNNDDRGVVPFNPWYQPDEWYKAARKWNEILRRKSVEYWFQLKPGNLLIFDNWRVLHGRAAFTGIRRICGAYINRDDFISRWRNTNYPREEINKRVIG
ncbi:trimethyllysine dioxygenase [Xylariaceae sp. FL0016]|nr:trimethyllysine dioxygenase [Xylariaceae sp. FL0016]